MLRHLSGLWLILVVVWSVSPLAASGAEQSGGIWYFQGDRIPASPIQDELWVPPKSDIPAEYVNKIVAAFKHGLADPRICEYREVEVPWGDDSFGGYYPLKTHGWLLPPIEKESQRFVILWNGLVYPVIAVGPAVSMRSDLWQLIAYTVHRNATRKNQLPVYELDGLKFPEVFLPNSFNYGTICALLLRLGETGFAEKLYRTTIKTPKNHAESFPWVYIDDIQNFTLWELFSRALAAHMYGDDKLALCYAKQYEPLLKDSQCEFISTARELLADQRRRAGKRPKAKNKIDALILDLENVNARQYGQPGSVILGLDGRVKALIAVGDPAVEPLLKCLENDRRLTRSVNYPRNFIPARNIIPVAQAAYMALIGILQQSFSFPGAIPGDESRRDADYRKKLAQRIRQYYNRYKNMSAEERWYHILQNGDEPAGIQLQVAANICRKCNVKEIPHANVGMSITTIDPRDKAAGLTGEALRVKSNPSVSELLNCCAIKYLPRDESAIATSGTFYNAQKMALYSAEWDLPNSLPALRKVSDAIYRELPKYDDFKSERLKLLVPLTIRRVKAGDNAALRQYCETLLAASKSVLGENGQNAWEEYMEPLYTFPKDAAVIAAAETIFNSSGNDWSKYFGKFQDTHNAQDWLFAKFMRLAPYRKHVENGLKDKTPIIKLQTLIIGDRADCRFEYLDRSGSGSTGYSADRVKNDPRFPGNKSTQLLRVCDIYAQALSSLNGGGYPVFQNYWDEKDRDRVIEEIASKLSQKNECP